MSANPKRRQQEGSVGDTLGIAREVCNVTDDIARGLSDPRCADRKRHPAQHSVIKGPQSPISHDKALHQQRHINENKLGRLKSLPLLRRGLTADRHPPRAMCTRPPSGDLHRGNRRVLVVIDGSRALLLTFSSDV